MAKPPVFIDNKRDHKHTTTVMPESKIRQGTFLKKPEEVVVEEVQVEVAAPSDVVVTAEEVEAKTEEIKAKVEEKAAELEVEVEAPVVAELAVEVEAPKAEVKEEKAKPEKKTGLKKIMGLGKKK
jgi:hypothetical protein